MSSGELPTARSHLDEQVGGEEADAAAEKPPRTQLPSSTRRSTLRPAPDDFRPSAAPTSRRPMVIVYSGDSVRVPDWSAEPARPPSEPPPSDGPLSQLPASEPSTVPAALAQQSLASADAAQLLPPEAAGWDDAERGSGSQPLPSLRGEGVAEAADRLTPLGPPWSEPAPPLPAASPARVKARPRLHLLTAALSGGALLAIGYFTFSAPKPAHPLAGESAPPAAKVEPTKSEVRRAPELPAVSNVAPPPAAQAVEAKADAAPAPALARATPAPARATPAPATPAPTVKAAAPATAKAVSAPDPASGSTRVRLEVIPADAKVGRRGFTQKGPPYYFEVPKGKRVQLEVVRKGYVTRKVTLDGSSSRVVIGLAKTRTAKR